jgi:hypothetical protein
MDGIAKYKGIIIKELHLIRRFKILKHHYHLKEEYYLYIRIENW